MPLIDPRENPTLRAGGAGLMSTAADYARFLQCLLGGGTLDGQRLLSPSTVRNMTADHLGSIGVNRTGRSGELLAPGYGFGGFCCAPGRGAGRQRRLQGACIIGWHCRYDLLRRPRRDFGSLMMIQAPNQRDYPPAVSQPGICGFDRLSNWPAGLTTAYIDTQQRTHSLPSG